jgi:hypothetical protein
MAFFVVSFFFAALPPQRLPKPQLAILEVATDYRRRGEPLEVIPGSLGGCLIGLVGRGLLCLVWLASFPAVLIWALSAGDLFTGRDFVVWGSNLCRS